jgi:hypothetical protein
LTTFETLARLMIDQLLVSLVDEWARGRELEEEIRARPQKGTTLIR